MSSRVFENEKLQIASDHSKICSKRFLISIPKIMELLKKCKLIKKNNFDEWLHDVDKNLLTK